MTRTIAVLGYCVLVSLIANACVEKSRELTQAEQEQLGPFISKQAPSPAHALDVSFEDKIRLIGYDVSPETVNAGGTLTITWYWKCERALEEGWRLFTHVGDAAGADRKNADGDGIVRQLYQPGSWKAGEYITDRQEISIPADWNSNRAVFHIGVWNGPHRLQVTQGPNDGENRVRAATVNVGEAAAPAKGAAEKAAPPPPRLPVLRATKTDARIDPDGNLDEEAWSTTRPTDAFVSTLDGSAAPFRATAKLLWDEQNLYVGVDVADDHLRSDFRRRDDNLWEADAVELMIDPGGRGQNYFELQVSPRGTIFDTRYDRRREPAAPGHVDYDSRMRAGVQTRGTVGDDEADQGYTVEMVIPWAAFAQGEPAYEAPSAGDTWRMNFYVMDARPGDEAQRSAGWSATRVPDFHMPARFGRVTFIDPAAPAPEPTGGAEGSPNAPTGLQLPPNVMKQLRLRAAKTTDQVVNERERNRPRPGETVPTRENPRGE